MNSESSRYLHHFHQPIESIPLPEQFTYPFCYETHPLCIAASAQLQHYLENSDLWSQHRALYAADEPVGKMFGVLVVQDQQDQLGFLCGFSGKLADSNHHDGFVPPVYDILDEENVFVEESQYINELNSQIDALTSAPERARAEQQLLDSQQQAQNDISALQQTMVETRKQRKAERAKVSATLSGEVLEQAYAQLAQQSIEEKHKLAAVKQYWNEQIESCQQQLTQYTQAIEDLKQERKQRSHALQHALFSNYRFLNAHREEAILIDLFKDTLSPTPPAGSGECAAPKLLQFAYQHQLKPVAMAEFWWGDSPRSAIRKHKKYYPSCQSKCLPILTHMLQGLDVEPNPLLINPATDKDIEIIYQDEAIVVVNKPEEMLSVPGVHIQDSAYTRLQALLGEREEGPFVIHRLDMSTSGLLVFALTKRANKSLQKQFITRHVEKRYIAEVEGNIEQDEGYIHLPLAADMDDKPRQMVCEKRGKPAETYWQVISRANGRTKLYLYPKTGRTHQLRVHCAHPLGHNSPMVGDDLYGDRATRLHLHAEMLSFDHPYTKERMTFQVDVLF